VNITCEVVAVQVPERQAKEDNQQLLSMCVALGKQALSASEGTASITAYS